MTEKSLVKRPSVEQIQELFTYDPDTGFIYWKALGGGKIKKKPAGTIENNGYLGIVIGKQRIRAHRIAWVLHHGKWPDDQIDHINGNGLDNRICNLREATNSQNSKNTKKPKNNTSGLIGVHFEKYTQRWRACIKVNYKQINLGRFVNFDEAVFARKEAEKKYFGEWARNSI